MDLKLAYHNISMGKTPNQGGVRFSCNEDALNTEKDPPEPPPPCSPSRHESINDEMHLLKLQREHTGAPDRQQRVDYNQNTGSGRPGDLRDRLPEVKKAGHSTHCNFEDLPYAYQQSLLSSASTCKNEAELATKADIPTPVAASVFTA